MLQKNKTWQGNSVKRRNSAFFLFVFLGMLTAFGPFVTDMYLPSLPAMGEYFSAGASLVQLGLTFSMLGLAVGQLLFGPLSDKYGRRPPLLAAMLLFLLSTVGCICAPSIEVFVALRFVQGIAGAGGIVISRSIAADKFKGVNLAKALALIGAINGLAPVAAPVIGGTALKIVSWKGIFGILFVLGVILLCGCINFKESLSKTKFSKKKISETLSMFKPLFGNKKYLFYVLQMSFAHGLLFAYISSSPFIIQSHYGYSSFAFGLLFAINSVAIVAGAAAAVKFKSQENCVAVSCCGMLICSILTALALRFSAPLLVFEGLLMAMLFMIGLTFTASVALALNNARGQAGTASALLGAMGFLFGSIVSPLVGLGDIMLSSGLVFIACACGSMICGVGALRRTAQSKVCGGASAA